MKSQSTNCFLFILFIVLVSMSISARAAKPGQPSMPDLQEIINELSLDPYQAEQLSQLVKEHHQQMRVTQAEKHELRENTRAMRISHREELLSVLTHEQLYQFESYMHQNRPKRKMNK